MHVNSRPWRLAQLKPGECLYLPAPPGRLAAYMQGVSVDAGRVGLTGRIRQTGFIAVQPKTREVVELVRVERLPD